LKENRVELLENTSSAPYSENEVVMWKIILILRSNHHKHASLLPLILQVFKDLKK